MPHSKTTFQESWFAIPEYKRWLARGKDAFSFGCKICKKYEFSCASMGVHALESHHAKNQKHIRNLKAIKNNAFFLRK